jgi:hypothetical protein
MKTSLFPFFCFLALWAAVVGAVGARGLFGTLPPLAAPVVIGGLTAGFSVALLRARWLETVGAQIGVRAVLSAHLVRFVGVYFLWLHAQGRLPVEFAQRAGGGDIVAATGALALLFMPEGPVFRRGLFWWNVIGAADLVVAVGTAGWLNFNHPGSMIEITRLPLILIPLWAVPVLFASHVYLLRQQICARRSTELETTGGLPAR